MRKISIALGAAVSLLVLGLSAGAAQASTGSSAHLSHLVFVSHHSAKRGADTSCSTARYHDINTAIAAVSTGGTVVVCAGTYDEQVVVTKPLNLYGRGATIDAKGQKPLTIAGPKPCRAASASAYWAPAASRSAASRVTGSGFDAILVGAKLARVGLPTTTSWGKR